MRFGEMMMAGTMQDWPLLVSKLIDHAAINHGDREIVSLSCEGTTHRTNWRSVNDRARRVAAALRGLGALPGDRVATLAWNTWRHVESWYGITGMGGGLPTPLTRGCSMIRSSISPIMPKTGCCSLI